MFSKSQFCGLQPREGREGGEMKIRIHLDVNKLYQMATCNVLQVGESMQSIYPKYDDTKRYEVIVDVPHETDATIVIGEIVSVNDVEVNDV